MKNGAVISTEDQWWKERRPEILKDVTEQMWGVIPPDSILPKITWSVVTTKGGSGAAAYIQKVITGTINTSRYPAIRNIPKITATLRTPVNATGKVPVMVIIGGSTDTYWNYAYPQGWGVCAFTHTDLQPDNGAGLTSYLIGLVNKGAWRKPTDWGTLGAWAWGVSKLIDYFETDPNVDATKVGVSGHSRNGKAATVAMAYDQRIFIGYPSCAGSMGTKMNRYHWGQDLENSSWDQEYHWMSGNFFKWMGEKTPGKYMPRKIEDCPVDAHSLIAMCAPRPIFINAGNQDSWNGPYGIYLGCLGASPVYEFLGKKGVIMPDVKPVVDAEYILGDIGHRYHNGGHTDAPDWPTFWKFAAKYTNPSPALGVSATSIALADTINSVATFNITTTKDWSIQKPSWLNINAPAGTGNSSVTIIANAINSLDSARIDTIYISTTGYLAKIAVLQPSKNAVLYISATPNDTLKISGAAYKFDVAVSSNSSWTVTTPSWVTSSSSAGANTKNLIMSIAASTDSVNSRLGKTFITVKNNVKDSVIIKQAPGVIIPSYANLWSSAYAMNITNVDIAAAGTSSGYFQVNSDVNVARTVTSSDSWLTVNIQNPTNTYGSWWYRVNLIAGANNTGATRIATVIVKLSRYAEKTITITQPAAGTGGGGGSTGTISLSQTAIILNSSASNTSTFDVTSDTTWTITSSQPWITADPSTDRKNATITLTAEANTVDSIRSAIITATIPSGTSKTITVSQRAPAPSSLDISVTAINDLPNTNNTTSFAITSDTIWTITSSAWLVPSLSTGMNNRTIKVAVGTNRFPALRTGFIKVTAGIISKTITVTQLATDPIIFVTPSKLTIDGNGEYIPTLTILSNTKVNVFTLDNWVTINPDKFSPSTTVVKLKASATEGIRIATVNVAPEGLTPLSYVITQFPNSSYLTLSTSAIELEATANSSANFDIASNALWSITSSESWLKVYPINGMVYGLGTVIAEKNPTTEPRSAIVTVTVDGIPSQTITITQIEGTATSIADAESDGIITYPNPIKEKLFVKLPGKASKITIHNLEGKELKLLNTLETEVEIDFSGYAPGVYFISINTNNNTITKKLVKF